MKFVQDVNSSKKGTENIFKLHYSNVEKYILEKYSSNHLKDEVVVDTKKLYYFLTRKIENPFDI